MTNLTSLRHLAKEVFSTEDRALWKYPTHLRITTLEHMPFSGTKLVNGTLVGQGLAFKIMDLVTRRMNFTYHIVKPETNVIGDHERGIMGMLNRKEVDMAVAFLPELPDFSWANFTSTLDTTDIRFLMLRPGCSATGSGFIAPFSILVWELIVMCMLIMGPLLWAFNKIRTSFRDDPGTKKFTLPVCLWYSYSAMIKQSTTSSPMADSTRFLFAGWWIFATVMTAYYTGNMTAVYTKTKYTLPIHTLEEMIDAGYQWFVTEGHTLDTMLQYNREEIRCLKKSFLWRYGKIVGQEYTPRQILDGVHEDKIYLAEAVNAQFIEKEEYDNNSDIMMHPIKRCPYIVNFEHLLEYPLSFALPKGSIFFDAINEVVTVISYTGWVKHYKMLMAPQAPACPHNLKIQERRLQIADMGMSLRTVFRSYIGGLVLLIIEICVFLVLTFYRSIYYQKIFRGGGSLIQGTGPRDQVPNQLMYPDDFDKSIMNRSPPPKYAARDAIAAQSQIRIINGQEYYVMIDENGEQKLIMMKNPSDQLFDLLH